MIGGLFSLIFFGAIIWGIVSVVRRFSKGSDERGDATVSFRRLFIYLLLLAALAIIAIGAQQVFEILFDTRDTLAGSDSARQARAVAFLLIGTPSYLLLYRHVTRRLASDVGERRSAGWRIYLNATLAVSLVAAMTAISEVIRAALDVSDYGPEAPAWALVASIVWLLHWVGPVRAYPPASGVHLAIGSVAGLAGLATAIVLVLLAAGDAIYDALVEAALAETPPADRMWQALSAFVVGAPVWWWHWLRPARREWDPSLWNGYVMIAGVLAAVITAVASLYTMVLQTGIWFFGDPNLREAAEHFDFLPTAVAFGVTGLLVWAYHAWIYNEVQAGRTEAVRIYEYAMAAIGLLAAAGGIAALIVAFLQAVGPSAVAGEDAVANVLIGAIVALIIGAPLWWIYWSRVERYYDEAPQTEATSTSRRMYTLALFGVSAIVAFVSLIVVAFIAFEDLFDGRFGGDTILDARVPIALTLTTGLLTWYHFGIYRRDRDLIDAIQPTGPKRITIVGRLDPSAVETLRHQLEGSVRVWERTDEAQEWVGDPDDLAALIGAETAEDVLVILEAVGPSIVPFQVR